MGLKVVIGIGSVVRKFLKPRPHLHAQFNTVLLWQHGARTAVVHRKFVHRDNVSSVPWRFEFTALQDYCLWTVHTQHAWAPLPCTHDVFVTSAHSFSSPFRSPSILLRTLSAWGFPLPSPIAPLLYAICWCVVWEARDFRASLHVWRALDLSRARSFHQAFVQTYTTAANVFWSEQRLHTQPRTNPPTHPSPLFIPRTLCIGINIFMVLVAGESWKFLEHVFHGWEG